MKQKFSNLIDVKSIITILLVVMLCVVVIGGLDIEEKVFNLFSNITTMVMTYFFTKKTAPNEGEQNDKN